MAARVCGTAMSAPTAAARTAKASASVRRSGQAIRRRGRAAVAGDGRGWLTFLERERRVTVEKREAVVTELVCRKRVDGRWETVVVDACIAYRRG